MNAPVDTLAAPAIGKLSSGPGAGTGGGAPASGPWIYRPWLDLIVGCGAWSAPLLAVAMWMTPNHTHGWAVAFYALALVFNYPHFMATVYRAYHTRADFEKYKFFTLHLTVLMVVAGALVHAAPVLLPWLFTLYICWSPWHYTGQNYGLMMMFARRNGAEITPMERRWLRAAFVLSFVMLLASFETGGSNDPLILSLGIPAKFTLPARAVLGFAFALCAAAGFQRLVRARGLRAMVAPLTLLLTQFLWFVLPTILELHAAYQVPQTRYSSGILAVMHSTQYLWITSYYQRREARAAGQSKWHMAGYFLVLVAGGIALFIPGPWLVSRIFRFDFTTSFLIFTAVVNIHHFLLDGALWKLRDTRVASLLISEEGKAGAQPGSGATARVKDKKAIAPKLPERGWAARVLQAPAFRVSVMALLFLWGGMDQYHFAMGTDEGNLSSLTRAAEMNSYDAALEARIAAAETKAGRHEEAAEALERAVEVNPRNKSLQHAYARALIEAGRYEDAYEFYGQMLQRFPRDPDALVNYGLLAAQLGRPDAAMDAWERAVEADPSQPNAQLYLAQALDQKGEPASAARHWEAFLRLAAGQPQDPAAAPKQVMAAEIQLGDDDARVHRGDGARSAYESAIASAGRAGDARVEATARGHLADAEDQSNDPKAAAREYQRALALDARSVDARGEAVDWFNYGQFLRRRGQSPELAYACLLQAESLLAGASDAELETVRGILRQMEHEMGKKAAIARGDLPKLLARALTLSAESF
ncbi:MAG: tetratricopeptide repeat protein [Candidatus Acidiferrales bacterium]